MSYESTLQSYQDLLADKPGQALEITSDTAAVMIDGKLLAGTIHQGENGNEIKTTFEFDPVGWDEECECWLSDDTGWETAYHIANPRFFSVGPL